MIQDILKSLSDTEIMAIAKELDNPMIPNQTILKQLMAKSNSQNPERMVEELTSPDILPIKVAVELSDRLRERDLISE